MISTWFIDTKNNKSLAQTSNNTQHQSGITCLKWNPSGKRLVTGDKVNLLKNSNKFKKYNVCNLVYINRKE